MFRVAKLKPKKNLKKSNPIADIWAGLVATYQDKMILNVLSINFVSSIFNAGSFLTVYPFIIKRVYSGDAFILSALMATFFAGAAFSNAFLLKFVPLRSPGKLFLIMQLSRIVVLFLLWLQPSWWLLVVSTVGWGLNMGVTSNLARAIVQESAQEVYRGRILSAFSVGMLGSAPIGAILLGNNLVNILASALATSLLIKIFGNTGVAYAVIIMTALIVIFAEILPKSYAIANAEKMALLVSPFLKPFVTILAPVTWLMEKIVFTILNIIGIKHDQNARSLSVADEIRGTVDLHHKEGRLFKMDKDMVTGILDLSETTVEDIMVHRSNISVSYTHLTLPTKA